MKDFIILTRFIFSTSSFKSIDSDPTLRSLIFARSDYKKIFTNNYDVMFIKNCDTLLIKNCDALLANNYDVLFINNCDTLLAEGCDEIIDLILKIDVDGLTLFETFTKTSLPSQYFINNQI